MDEQQILEQLNELKQEVKPREKWVNMTKDELFQDAQQQKAAATLISKAFAPLQKPALALTALGLVAMVLSGGLLYSPQLVKIDKPMPTISNDKPDPQLAASVEKLSASLVKVNEKLTEVKDSDNIEEIIPKLAVIEATARQGAKIATTAQSTKTFASLADSFTQTANAANTRSAQIIKEAIKGFEKNKEYLSDIDQTRLEKAKKAYEEKNYSEAFLLLKPLLQE